jgi:hypothetical protein
MAKPVANSGASKSSRHVPRFGAAPSGKKPMAGREKGKTNDNWSFSFRYWKQINYFGLEGKDGKWFISLLERMKDVSQEPLKRIQTDRGLQDSLRYHDINWGQTNIPIKREDLTSLPQDIRENENDFPIFQFSISKALGRIAGFWDDSVFNVVLLDPYHNLQPLKEFNYRVTATSEMPNEHEMLVANLNLIKKSATNCSGGVCSTQKALQFIELHDQPFGILYLDADYFNKAKELIKTGKVKSVEELTELGVLQLS